MTIINETGELAQIAYQRLKNLSKTIFPYERKKQASVNRTELTPVHFLIRAVQLQPERIAIKHNLVEWSYKQLQDRILRLAYRLIQVGVKKGDRVGFLCKNIPPLLEAHFAIPAVRAVIVCINYRLSEKEVLFISKNAGLKLLFYETQYLPTLSLPGNNSLKNFCRLIKLNEGLNSYVPYSRFLKESWNDLSWEHLPYEQGNEDDVIAINYTSGTTGTPKGVMYTYRSVTLNVLNIILSCNLSFESVYLWTLPLSHCNGWCFSWANIAAGALNIMLPEVNYDKIWFHIKNDSVTHMCGTPTMYDSILKNPQCTKNSSEIYAIVGGFSPSFNLIKSLEEHNFKVQHGYGLTESYGPTLFCWQKSNWKTLKNDEKYTLLSRQGRPSLLSGNMKVVDKNNRKVENDGKSVGEILLRGHLVMKGYYNDEIATKKAFKGGWFHTGDLAVVEKDGYIHVCDRIKDVIISGGENISSMQVENVLNDHKAIKEAAVVGKQDKKWGERPIAYVVLKNGYLKSDVLKTEISEFCKKNLTSFKCPDSIIFLEDLPKTVNGKIQKYFLKLKFNL